MNREQYNRLVLHGDRDSNSSSTLQSDGEHRSSRSVVTVARRHRRHTLTTMTVLLGSVLLLSACNPITAQNIKLSAAAATGAGAGMMRPLRDVGMTAWTHPDVIGRVLSVHGSKVKMELMESSASKIDAAARSNASDVIDQAATATSRTDKVTGTSTGTNGADYTATGKKQTITLSQQVQISEMSTLMEHSGGRNGGMSRGERHNDGSLGSTGTATSSDSSASGSGLTDPTRSSSSIAGANAALPATSRSTGGSAVDHTSADRTPTNGVPSMSNDAQQAELKTGDIVMVWYEPDEAVAKRIVILPLQ
ncbi:hypothetical protein [Paenibacillus campi]|uniref:hypothetical protein n=1 Tax=Paenibacillus campi TaxID=3106031 RepID=UPI002B001C74|nr:hypothetical protein [Paenibacillus sp. SGZ-1014]